MAKVYKELDSVEIPDDVPEAGIRAGDLGAVVDIAPDGTLTVDVVEPGTGRTLDMLFVEPGPPLRVVGRWRAGEA